MKCLLDTHIVLWAITKSECLTKEMRSILEDVKNTIYYSPVSVWEVAIKHKLHPEKMPVSEEDFVSYCSQIGFVELPICNAHIFAIKRLERRPGSPNHQDPFDRLLISQAKTEQLIFITHDTLLSDYNERCILTV